MVTNYFKECDRRTGRRSPRSADLNYQRRGLIAMHDVRMTTATSSHRVARPTCDGRNGDHAAPRALSATCATGAQWPDACSQSTPCKPTAVVGPCTIRLGRGTSPGCIPGERTDHTRCRCEGTATGVASKLDTSFLVPCAVDRTHSVRGYGSRARSHWRHLRSKTASWHKKSARQRDGHGRRA